MSEEGISDSASNRPRFEIFRGSQARDYGEHNLMAIEDVSPLIADGLSHFNEAGEGDGQQVKLLFSAPGFSLTHVWFKSGYPLPLHAHRSDCLYYIIAGNINLGTESLGPGDGFFVGTDVPYTYAPGPNGVEVLEFRNTDELNIRFLTKTVAAWSKISETLKARRSDWVNEQPPSRAVRAEQNSLTGE
jgi:hypothetical protein